jgi:hypothetical protein
MDLKDKFQLNSQKFQQKKIEEREGKEFESFDYLDSFNDKKTRFLPPVDYTKFQNFVRFGLAEEYVESSFENIIRNYPYDGSRKEKIDWENSATPYNLHVFEKKYPRTNGYATFSPNGWGVNGGFYGSIFGISNNPEYITIKGGPNKDNIYDPSKNRNSNLALNLSSSGFTTEFWFKIDQNLFNPAGLSKAQVFVDYWNNESPGSSQGRLTIFAADSETSTPIRFSIESGSFSDTFLLGDSNLFNRIYNNNEWLHAAITYQNQTASLFINGELYNTDTTAVNFGDIGGAINANIGGLISGSVGAGKMSGSLDEFRHWKAARTDQEIGQNWYTQVYGGSNTDDANTALGVYLKFNEGITGNSSIDSVVLDYSGRASNGAWTGYSATSRNTGSAIVLAGAATSEFKDPILYETHPELESSKSELITFAKRYDGINQSSFYDLFPGYLIDEDEQNGGGLKKLVQVMASYLDSLQLQIDFFNETKNINYYGDFKNSNVKQIPFVKEQIIDKGFYIDDLFLESDLIESLSNKTYFDNYEFEKELYEVKNLIYQNFYNNLNSIVKSKGTLKSIRNALRTFGVDEDLISIEKFADNALFELNDSRESKTTKRRFLRFNKINNTESCIYNYGTAVSDSVITGTFASSSLTFETEVIFPSDIQAKNFSNIYKQGILTGSIFGVQSANAALNTTIPDNDADIKVLFERLDTTQNSGTRFVLTSSNGSIPTLSSSYFFNVYDDSHWNFAIRVKPNYLQSSAIQKTGSIDYEISFYGICNYGDRIIEKFNLTSSLDKTTAETFIAKNKRVYAGAFNNNITGSNVYKTDIKLGNVRAWIGYLDNETLDNHAFESNNLGTKGNYLNALTLESNYKDNITKNNTLLFNWNFDFNNAISGTSFVDVSSGAIFNNSPAINEFPAASFGFENSPVDSLSTELLIDYVVSEPEKQLKENDISFDKREIEEQRFSKNQKFVDYSFIVKKSPYAAINKEILKYYTAIKDFHNFIGSPVNRYRDEYKELRRERELFFKKISNQIDVEKFIKFYKWVDSGLSTIIYQLIPESVKFDPEVLTLIESHLLERPKYKNKFPTIEFKKRDPIAAAQGINRLQTNWKFNHAPVSALQDSNCKWWNVRANRSGSVLTSGDSNVDSDREQIRIVKESAINRLYTTPQSFKVDELYSSTNTRKANYWDAAIQEFGRIVDVDGPGPLTASVSVDYLLVKAANVYDAEDCNDIIIPNKKVKKSFKIENSREFNLPYSFAKGHLLAPFTLWSSSVDSGYQADLAANFKTNIGLNNHHDDNYLNFVNAPLQSPFTEGWVGGRGYRHIALNDGSDTNGTRPEGFYLLAGADLNGSASLGVVKTTYTSNGTHDFNTPRASLYREELAKRPINIANRQYSTSSARLGNFQRNYEVVMTSGRTKNNLWFHDNSSQVLSQTEVWNLNRGTTSPYLDATLPTRGVAKSVIVNRFSAPGGPENQSRGYLEATGEEFSPYNAYPFRNTNVLFSSGSNNNDFTGSNGPRVNIYTNIHTNNDGLRSLLSRHSGKFGIDSVYGTVRAEDYNTTGSYLKINRNPLDYRAQQQTTIAGVPSVGSVVVAANPSLGETLTIAISPITNIVFTFVNIVGSDTDISLGGSGAATLTNIINAINTQVFTSLLMIAAPASPKTLSITWLANGENNYPITTSSPNLVTNDFAGGVDNFIDTYSAKKYYDNFFVSHQIPRTPAGYSWIRSLQNGSSGSFAYSRTATRPSGSSSEEIPFTTLATSIQQGDSAEYSRAFTGLLSGTTPTVAYLTSSLFASIIDQGSTEFTNELTINSLPSQSFGVYSHGINNSIFGHNTFSQIRGGETIQGRSFKKNNKIPITFARTLSNGNTQEFAGAYNEPAVLKKFYPFKHTISTLVSEDDERLSNISYSYLNNKYFYSDNKLNNLLNKNNSFIFGTYDVVKRSYDRRYNLNGVGTVIGQTPSKFKYLISKEVIFPKAKNTFLKEHRGRTNFTVDWWKSSRAERNITNLTSSFGYEYSYSKSFWALDGFSDSSSYSGATLTASSDQGEYQTNKTFFFRSATGAEVGIELTPTYARPVPSGAFDVSTGSGKILTGVTPWSAPVEAGKEPFYYSDYDAYHEKIRLVGQDHTIVPEFRISNHIEQIEQAGGNALIALDNMLSIEGGESGISQSRFYEEYSHTDFLQYFNALREDLNGFGDDGRTEKVSLECKAIMKFLPYEGFYPAQRTQQIASLFSQSYGSALETPGSASFRVLQTPFFGPGILYNSIKSGISLPFPVYTSSVALATTNTTYTGISAGATYPYKFINGSLVFADNFKYLSFESLLNPNSVVGSPSGDEIYDYEPMIEASASLESALLTSIPAEKTYEYSINNFLAETLNLFNNKEKSGIILSNPDNNFKSGFDTTKTYSMDIEFNEVIKNYSRRSAYGAPVNDLSAPESDSYAIYTPGYRANGNNKTNNVKVLRLEFNPTKETHTADEILSSLTGTYYTADGGDADGAIVARTFVAYTDIVNLIKVPLTFNSTTNTPAFGIGIQPKWQSPILDFSQRTASVPPTENQDFYSTGMWHQYGALPLTDKTVEIKVVKSSNTTNENLAEILGLSDKSINVGHLPDKKEVKEAIIAIPFIKDQNSNEKNFFEIDREYIADALYNLGIQDTPAREGFKAGRSIVDMVSKMQNYVLPPRIDFLTYKTINPIAMYIFEFSHTFSKQDLADIWQNLPPTSTEFDQDITTGFKTQASKLDYYINYSSRAVEFYGLELPVFDESVKGTEIRWMIFKVKQKAATNYFDTLASVPMETDSIKEQYPMVDKIPYSIPRLPRHSYNWPYDYFSMVELIKIDAEVNFGKGIVRNPGEFNIPLAQPPVLSYVPPADGPRRIPGDVEDSTRGDNYFETTGADEREAEQRRQQARELRSLNENADRLRGDGPGLAIPDIPRRR